MERQVRYDIDNREFQTSDHDAQSILKSAHEEKSRARCLCSNEKPKMYVAHIQGTYILKRMPGTGHLHDPSRESFDPPPELSGRAAIHGSAIKIDEKGKILIKPMFALSSRNITPRGEESDVEVAKEDVQKDPQTAVKVRDSKLSLVGMLHYLWNAAELTKHRPAWTGKRDWFIVRRELMVAISRSRVSNAPLSSIFFIPPPFRVDRKDEIKAARNNFMQKLTPQKGKPGKLGVIVGVFKGITDSAYGKKLTLKHLLDFPFYLDDKAEERFARIFEDRIHMAEAANGGCFIVIATFVAKGNHGQIKEISGMAVNSQWIPFENYLELSAIDQALDRGITKCLRYNLGLRDFIPNMLLTDMESPVSIYTPEIHQDDEAADFLIERAKDGPYRTHIIWAGDENRRLPTI